ncbi:DUF4352 domain-containing protein [Desulfosporosinus meridiei]|uniref:Telomeric repeat-binding factor 2 n=1 Tax=Desulfosporosinus meridiei (strain ATCC BAA-275 / DSM 13257 / KCTC 12902 / NCIMB 13706 / S10) TaxID=768704 RepID=J7IUN1_DESMD|nr:DUF4352 domain-containing protein [Desulfosporosinus meridiei]AFQ45440.1 Telomeric repeat-binding factor 2 [Desulfosporosinus meridiei DSM 13257]
MGKIVTVGKAGKQRRYCSQAQYCLLVLLVPTLLFLLGAGALTTQAHTNSPQFLTSQGSIPVFQDEYKLGETFKIGNLQYRIDSVRTSTGKTEIRSPRQGNVYLFVNLTIENKSLSDVEVRSVIGFKLKDSNGQSQESSLGAFLGAKNHIDGTIRSAETINGELGYEVSQEAKEFSLIVIPDPLDSKAKNVSVKLSIDK